MADTHEVTEFVVSSTRLLNVIRDDFELTESDELLVEGVIHCLVKELLERQERREISH